MPVTERLMGAGDWSLRLRDDTPWEVLDALDLDVGGFGTLVITPTWVPSTMGAATIRSLARWSGVLIRRDADGLGIGGWHVCTLLGSDDGRGPVIDPSVGNVWTLSQWLSTGLFPAAVNGVTAGTVTNTGYSYQGGFYLVTYRQALDLVCAGVGAEWRVNPNLTIDAAAPATLWGSTPSAIVARRSDGRGATVQGLKTRQLSTGAVDIERWVQGVKVIARRAGAGSLVTQTAASPYKAPGGSADLVWTQVVDAQDVDPASASQLATNLLTGWNTLTRQISVSVEDYDIAGIVRPGNYLWLYDPQIGIWDTANQVVHRGETVFPLKTRCVGATWPIEAGMGVYFVKPNAAQDVIDLTRLIVPEQAGATLEVGALPSKLSGSRNTPTAVVGIPSDVVFSEWQQTTVTFSSTGGGSVTSTGTAWWRYRRIGSWVTAILWVNASTITQTGGSAGNLLISLPLEGFHRDGFVLGQGTYKDSGSANVFEAKLQADGSNWSACRVAKVGKSTTDVLGTIALGSGVSLSSVIISAQLVYEVAGVLPAAYLQPDDTASCELWWDASAISAANGTAIVASHFPAMGSTTISCSSIRNASTNAEVRTNTQNAKTTALMNVAGIGQQLNASAALAGGSLGDFEVFFVGKVASVSGVLVGGTTNNYKLLLRYGGAMAAVGFHGAIVSSSAMAVATGSYGIWCWSRSGATLSFYENGSSLGTASLGSDTWTTGAAVSDAEHAGSGTGGQIQGNLGEIIVYKRALSSTERAQVLAYLNAKWAIY